MIVLSMAAPQFFNDASEIIRLFVAQSDITMDEQGGASLHITQDMTVRGSLALHRVTIRDGDGVQVSEYAYESAHEPSWNALLATKYAKRGMKVALFRAMRPLYPEALTPWGSLTGIRPTKLLYELLEAGQTREEASHTLRDTFDVSGAKIALAGDVVRAQRGVIRRGRHDEIDVYVGIPFCVSRCTYCSFAACDIRRHGALVAPYLKALHREIAAGAALVQEHGWRVNAVYIGGGTPTALPCDALEAIVEQLRGFYGDAAEWTVEAGRPDTITEEMLRMLRRSHIGRISINPQTMHDDTLARIGRAHTADDIRRAVALAREQGFSVINMDLITALPGEDEAMFASTLADIAALGPENVTIHTLSVKRASALHGPQASLQAMLPAASAAARMVEAGARWAKENGYTPYYLYRQKYMSGNLENVGFCRRDTACRYNIDIMEETHPILAHGAGAISKRIVFSRNRIDRFACVKNIEHYIARIDEMIEKKNALFSDTDPIQR